MADANHSVRSDPNKLIGKTVSHYTVQEVLGHGGMGVVYRAEDTHLHRLVALKFLPPTLSQDTRAKERFLVEAQAASALDHPNIGTIYEFGETNTGQLFIAMAYYAGESLRSKLERGPLSSLDALDYGIQIARGLAAAHEAGIVHRDIKPANVIVTDDGLAKIVDFGIARVGDAHLTQTGATTGTTGYMSPEQTRGDEVDGRADIWALGALLYETLTGVRPFRGDYDEAVVYSILYEDPEPMTSVNPAVSANIKVVVERCLQKSPAMRYQDAGELVADLDAVQRGEAPASFLGPSWLKHPRKSILAVAAVALLVVIAGLYVLILDRGENHSPESALAEAEPGIAVLPFTVQGQELEVLRDGMVSLLSTGLDGAGGLRTISSGTVFARWGEHVSDGRTPELATLLDIATETGARYAVVGSAIGIGSIMRLVADVYNVESGERIGQAQAEGSSDDILPVVDRLAVEILGVIFEGRAELFDVDLSQLLTSSPEALRAYLEAEIHYRNGEWDSAIEGYTRALDADSTFASVYSHLGNAYGWSGRNELSQDSWDRAVHLADRLPERERILAFGWRNIGWKRLDVVESLRRAVQQRPNDAEIWYVLGENLIHVAGALASVNEVEEAFLRATEIDPTSDLYALHLLDTAFRDIEESPRSASRIEGLPAYNRIAALLAPDNLVRTAAIEELRALPLDSLPWTALSYPRIDLDVLHLLRESTPEVERECSDDPTVLLLHAYASWRGRAREARPYFEEIVGGPNWSNAYWQLERGLPMRQNAFDAKGAFGISDSHIRPRGDCPPPTAQGISLAFLLYGTHSMDRGQPAGHAEAVTELEKLSEEALANNDSLSARFTLASADALEGYVLMRRGQIADALPILERTRWLGPNVRWWLGEAYAELGRTQDAIQVFEGFEFYLVNFSVEPLARRRLGQLYEQLRAYDKAREAYEYFVEYWNEADPELQPMVEEARQAIIRLQGM